MNNIIIFIQHSYTINIQNIFFLFNIAVVATKDFQSPLTSIS